MKQSLVKQAVNFILIMASALHAHASTEGVVISQVFGGNGNAYNTDYVELFNASASPVDITGWSVQYASATGSGTFANNGITSLNGTLQPGQYYLVGLNSSGSGTALPTADATGISNLSGSKGKVVLVDNSSGLACNGGSTACSASQEAEIIDLVGYGSANYFETSVAPFSNSSSALLRANNGCTDTDNNGSDFSVGTATPRNTSSTFNLCNSVPSTGIIPVCNDLTLIAGNSGNVSLSATDSDNVIVSASVVSSAVPGVGLLNFVTANADGATATVDLTVANSVAAGSYPVEIAFANDDGQIASCVATVTINSATAFTPIYDIQGSGTASPFDGQIVTTQGVVTAVFPGLKGFYMQDATGDNNPATSDGIFVYVNATPTVSVGDEVRVEAAVDEFFTITELVFPTSIQVLGAANAIVPKEISFPETIEGDLEAYEGMLVKIITPMTAAQNYFQGRYGQVTLASDGRLVKPTNVYRPSTTDAINLADENARRRITLDDGTTSQNPFPIPYIGLDNTLRAGDVVDEITGVIHHGLITSSSSGPSDYLIHPTEPVTFSRVNNRTATPQATGGNIKVASFNVLNYFTTFRDGNTASGLSGQGCSQDGNVSASNCRGASNQNEFTRQRDKIINAIIALDADVIGLMEIQNNGATAMQDLVNGLNAIAGPGTYAIVDDTVVDMGTDAIKNALIYQPANLSLVGNPLSDTDPINDRPTIAQTFASANGEQFSVLVNHFKSKSTRTPPTGLDVDQGDGQGAYNYKRTLEAQRLVVFAETVKTVANDDDVLIIGDLNAYGKEDPIDTLETAGYEDQIARFIGGNAYSFTFDGEVGYLDHALANNSMARQVTNVVHWHINTDEPFVIDYNTEFKSQDLYTNSVYRSSDHDPVLVGLNLYKYIDGTNRRDNVVGSAGDDVITGGIGRDNLTGGAGADEFVYNSLRDAGDTIHDFVPGEDVINIRTLLNTIGYFGNNPVADGYLLIQNTSRGALVKIDADGSGPSRARPLVLLKQISSTSLDLTRDFI